MTDFVNEDIGGSPMPPARQAALRRIMLEKGIQEHQIDAEIERYRTAGATIMVPSDIELRAMQAHGKLASDEELSSALE